MDLRKVTSQNEAQIALIGEIERGRSLVLGLGDTEYAVSRDGGSSIGAHIRHNLDFVNAMLNGVDDRRIDYNARMRDPRIEIDPRYAAEQMAIACERLMKITPGVISSLVIVRSETDQDLWHTSSVSREVEFLHSHTVHHYALVKIMMMANESESLSPSFGVSPSTLRYRKAVGGRQLCSCAVGSRQ